MSAFGGIWTHEYEYIRTWVEPLRPLGHECLILLLFYVYIICIIMVIFVMITVPKQLSSKCRRASGVFLTPTNLRKSNASDISKNHFFLKLYPSYILNPHCSSSSYSMKYSLERPVVSTTNAYGLTLRMHSCTHHVWRLKILPTHNIWHASDHIEESDVWSLTSITSDELMF